MVDVQGTAVASSAHESDQSPVNQSRLLQFFVLNGYIFVVVIVVGWVLVPGVVPVSPGLSAQATAEYFQGHRTAYLVAAASWEIGMQAMLLWLLAVARYLWKIERGPRMLTIASTVSSLTVPYLMMIAGAALAVAAYRPLEEPGITRAFSDLFYWIADAFVPPVSFGMLAVAWLVHRTRGQADALPRYTIWLSVLAGVTMPLLWTPFFAKTGVFAANGLVGYFIPMGTWCLWTLGLTPALYRAVRSPEWLARS